MILFTTRQPQVTGVALALWKGLGVSQTLRWASGSPNRYGDWEKLMNDLGATAKKGTGDPLGDIKEKAKKHSFSAKDPMLQDLLKERSRLCNRIESTGWRRIPNCSGISIQQGEWNPYLIGTGLDRRTKGELEIHVGTSERSRAMNKYLKYEVKSLKMMVKRGQLQRFWKTAWRLMERSAAFRTAAFNYCFYGWYKYRTLSEVVRINLTANRIIKERKSRIDFMRVFIPKANGKERPLGVPTCAWRLVLHMYSNFLGILLREELSDFNHAYVPKQGTLSCVKEWLTKVIKEPWVYEFDIKGFFDNVSIKDTLDKLEERGLPPQMYKHFETLLESTPKNIDFKKGTYKGKTKTIEGITKPRPLIDMDKDLGEREHWKQETGESMLTLNAAKDFAKDPFPSPGESTGFFLDDAKAWGDRRLKNIQLQMGIYDATGTGTSKEVNKPKSLKTKLDFYKEPPKDLVRGLPQGAAISPVLSLLALIDWKRDLKKRGINLLMYADDGMLYADKEFKVFPPKGFELASEKSGWLKKAGNWMTESQKFLGVRYHRASDMISGETRSGKLLTFGRKQVKVLELLRAIMPAAFSTPPVTRLDALMKSSLDGYAVSRLYGGSWEVTTFPEHWSENLKEKTWWTEFKGSNAVLVARRKLQITASSEACNWLGGLLTAIVNPDTKPTRPGLRANLNQEFGGGIFDMQHPIKGQPEYKYTWRDWLASTLKKYGPKRGRPKGPTQQDIKDAMFYNPDIEVKNPEETKSTSTAVDRAFAEPDHHPVGQEGQPSGSKNVAQGLLTTRGRGRPKGSLNQIHWRSTNPMKRSVGRPKGSKNVTKRCVLQHFSELDKKRKRGRPKGSIKRTFPL